jgi:hypothetical protein
MHSFIFLFFIFIDTLKQKRRRRKARKLGGKMSAASRGGLYHLQLELKIMVEDK